MLRLLWYLHTSTAFAFPLLPRLKKREEEEEGAAAAPEGVTKIPRFLLMERGLVSRIGQAVFREVDKHSLLFRLAGVRLDEESAVNAVAVLCNLIYCSLVGLGFLVLPRGTMLAVTFVTFPVGPALVFLVFGVVALGLVAFATFPMLSVAALWCGFFLTTNTSQRLALALGLDTDKDGDVDVLDVLNVLARTRLGKLLHLGALHAHLNAKSRRDVALNALPDKVAALERNVQQLTRAVQDIANATATQQRHEDDDGLPDDTGHTTHGDPPQRGA